MKAFFLVKFFMYTGTVAKSNFNTALKDFNIGGTIVGRMNSPNVEITVNCQYD